MWFIWFFSVCEYCIMCKQEHCGAVQAYKNILSSSGGICCRGHQVSCVIFVVHDLYLVWLQEKIVVYSHTDCVRWRKDSVIKQYGLCYIHMKHPTSVSGLDTLFEYPPPPSHVFVLLCVLSLFDFSTRLILFRFEFLLYWVCNMLSGFQVCRKKIQSRQICLLAPT